MNNDYVEEVEECKAISYDNWSENLTLIEQTLPPAFECKQQCYAGSWTGKDTYLRENVSMLMTLDLPFQIDRKESHLERFLKDAMAHMLTAMNPQQKSLIRAVTSTTYDHVVIAWPKIRPELLIPRKVALSAGGQPIVFHNEPKLIPMDIFADPLTIKVVKWTSDRERLDKMDGSDRFVINSIKKYMNTRSVALFIHKEENNSCGVAAAGMPHVHVLVDRHREDKAVEICASHDEDLHVIRKKVLKANGDVTVQPVRNVIGFTGHLMNKPRLYLGSNDDRLHDLIKTLDQGDLAYLRVTEEACLGDVLDFVRPYDQRFEAYNWLDDSVEMEPTVLTASKRPLSISQDEDDDDTLDYQIKKS